MKKIALCYAGLPINGNCCIDDFLEKFGLNSSGVDLYACFWDCGICDKLIDETAAKFGKSFISYIEQKELKLSFPEGYFVFPETNVSRVLAMFYIRERLLELVVAPGEEYDAYIFVRFDATIEKEINFKKLIEKLKGDNEILLPLAGNYRNGYTDTIAICGRLGIESYLATYSRLLHIIESTQKYSPPKNIPEFIKEIRVALKMMINGKGLDYIWATPLHPEVITRRNIELSGLTPYFFDVGDIFIKRDDYVTRLTVQDQMPSLLLASSMKYISIN